MERLVKALQLFLSLSRTYQQSSKVVFFIFLYILLAVCCCISKVVIMKHDDIKHQVDIEGITYINLTENHIKDVIDFYFDVFLQGNMY